MRDEELREELIENIVKLAVKYELDGINIDFENMYEQDKKLFSISYYSHYFRFLKYGISLNLL